ncbi:hypothetical protein POHY109586_17210 [Polaromonas hydrogenivorans]
MIDSSLLNQAWPGLFSCWVEQGYKLVLNKFC